MFNTSTPVLASHAGTDGTAATQPTSYATAQVKAAYVAAMHRRAAYLMRTGTRGLVYVSADPPIINTDYWARTLARVRRKLSPAKTVTFAQVWKTDADQQRYVAEWDDYADTLTGLVVVTGRRGVVGVDTVREINAALQRDLPILVHGPVTSWIRCVPFVPLVDCLTEPLPGDKPSSALHIKLPTQQSSKSETMIACLAAMGANQ